MKKLSKILAIGLALMFELIGRILAQIASVAMSVATILLQSQQKTD